jgi:hypothetical protein
MIVEPRRGCRRSWREAERGQLRTGPAGATSNVLICRDERVTDRRTGRNGKQRRTMTAKRPLRRRPAALAQAAPDAARGACDPAIRVDAASAPSDRDRPSRRRPRPARSPPSSPPTARDRSRGTARTTPGHWPEPLRGRCTPATCRKRLGRPRRESGSREARRPLAEGMAHRTGEPAGRRDAG